MKYSMATPKEIHWEFNPELLKSNSYVDIELLPRYEIYQGKAAKNEYKMMMRWTFRLFDLDNRQIIGYVTETDLFITYTEEKDNKERVKNMLNTTHLNFSLGFEEKVKPIVQVENLRIRAYDFTDATIEDILNTFRN